MQTIKRIRILQVSSQVGLTIMTLIGAVFVGAILKFYRLQESDGYLLGDIFLVDACITGVLLLIVRRARCPVCKNTFIGRTEPRWFTVTCKNCGRRSGDTH